MTKMTYSNALATVIALESVQANAELCEKLTALKVSIDKKSASKGTHKPTKVQKENVGIKDKIVEILSAEPERLFTITEIVKALDMDISNQKVSALVRQLYLEDSPLVVRVEDKRKAYFKIA